MRTMVYPGGANQESWTYDSKGRLKTRTDQRGITVTLGYDAIDRKTSEVYTSGATVIANLLFSYDATSNLVESLDTITGLSQRNVNDAGLPGFDAFNRLTDTRLLMGVATLGGGGTLWRKGSYTYTADSQRDTYSFTVSDAPSVVTHSYSYLYDLEGRLFSVTRTNPTPSKTYLSVFYDKAGRRNNLLFQNGSEVIFARDSKGRLHQAKAMNSSMTTLASFTYGYNARDERTSLSYDHLGVKVDFLYDDLSRLTSEAWSGNTEGLDSFQNQFTSAPPGNESAFSSPAACAFPLSQALPVSSYFGLYDYDECGNRTGKLTSSGFSSLAFDAENRVTSELKSSVTLQAPSSVSASSTASGYTTGPISDLGLADGTSAALAWKSTSSSPHTVTLDYGATAVSIVKVRAFFPSTKLPTRFKPQYFSGGTWQDFAIQAATGVTAASGGYWTATLREATFGFAAVSTTQVRFLQDGGGGSSSEPEVAYLNEFDASKVDLPVTVSYDYTLNGTPGKSPNIQKITSGTTVEDLSYDYKNRMVGYVKTVNAAITADFSYIYLPGGERLAKVNHQQTNDNEEWYFSDGADVVADYSRSSGSGTYTMTSTYVQSLGIDDKHVRIKAHGTELYYLGDALGSVHRIIDQAQAIQNTALTTAWGEKHPGFSDQVGVPDRRGFTGRDVDAESGLMDFRARNYIPGIGRFAQKDPIGVDYLYAGNNPVSRTDPTGEYWVIPSDTPDHYGKAVLSWAARYFGAGFSVEGGKTRSALSSWTMISGRGRNQSTNVRASHGSSAQEEAQFMAWGADDQPHDLVAYVEGIAAARGRHFWNNAVKTTFTEATGGVGYWETVGGALKASVGGDVDPRIANAPGFEASKWSFRTAEAAAVAAVAVKAAAVAGVIKLKGLWFTFGGGAATAASTPQGQQILQRGAEAIARLPVPGNLDLGRQLWGTTPEFARTMLQQIGRGRLESMGVTRDWLVQWIRFYENEAVRAATEKIINPSLQPRLELLKKALELLGG